MTERPARVLPIIVFSQFCGGSLWFAGNAVLSDLEDAHGFTDIFVTLLTSSVQAGFITGTLLFAFLNVADRYSPRRVFLVCALVGAVTNLALWLGAFSAWTILIPRFLTGVCLAGIYPVGMKIAASWFARGLGSALGFLVGALVVGTAFPHLLKGSDLDLPLPWVVCVTSSLAVVGGLLMITCVPDGPHLPRRSPFNPAAIAMIFRSREFRSSAFGYFGHMWELYTLWAFVPLWLAAYMTVHEETSLDVPFWSFAIIVVGAVGCIGGGWLSRTVGSARVAAAQLFTSGFLCLVSPWLLTHAPVWLFLAAMLLWGVTVVGDSPQYSTLNAMTAPREYVGSALTIVTCIGFFLTIPSIQLLGWYRTFVEPRYLYLPLVIGPLFGLVSLRRILASESRELARQRAR